MQWIANIVLKLIPTNWYESKKNCDIITKVCDTVVYIKADITIWLAIVGFTSIVLAVCFVLVMRYKYLKK